MTPGYAKCHPLDRLEAKLRFDVLSKVCVDHPFIARRLVGRNVVKWTLSTTPAINIGLQKVSGSPNHIAVFKTAVEGFRRERRGNEKLAIAFGFGSVLLAAEVPDNEQIVTGALRAGIPLGHTDLEASFGLLNPTTRGFRSEWSSTILATEPVSQAEFDAKFSKVPLLGIPFKP